MIIGSVPMSSNMQMNIERRIDLFLSRISIRYSVAMRASPPSKKLKLFGRLWAVRIADSLFSLLLRNLVCCVRIRWERYFIEGRRALNPSETVALVSVAITLTGKQSSRRAVKSKVGSRAPRPSFGLLDEWNCPHPRSDVIGRIKSEEADSSNIPSSVPPPLVGNSTAPVI